MHCNIACMTSQEEKCVCICEGKNHGTQASFITVEKQKPQKKPVILFTPIPNVRQCAHCPLAVHFEQGKGWVHPDGKAYIMECPECDWQGEEPMEKPITIKNDICPNCGVVGKLRDNHVAMPGKVLKGVRI